MIYKSFPTSARHISTFSCTYIGAFIIVIFSIASEGLQLRKTRQASTTYLTSLNCRLRGLMWMSVSTNFCRHALADWFSKACLFLMSTLHLKIALSEVWKLPADFSPLFPTSCYRTWITHANNCVKSSLHIFRPFTRVKIDVSRLEPPKLSILQCWTDTTADLKKPADWDPRSQIIRILPT